MVKVLGVCGSPRKAATYYALEQALAAAGALPGVETELISLRGLKFSPCTHCNKCVREQSVTCTLFNDDLTPLLPKLLEADGVILASPVYDMNFTPQMSGFLSRYRGGYVVLKDNPDYFAKKVGGAIAVGGTRNGGQECVINSLMGFFHTNGMTPANGGLCMYAGASVWSKDQGAEGAAADENGMNRCRRLGQKVARLAMALKDTTVFDEVLPFDMGH